MKAAHMLFFFIIGLVFVLGISIAGCEGDKDEDERLPNDKEETDGEDFFGGDDFSSANIWEDEKNGLMWQVVSHDGYTWHKANEYCENLNLVGYDDWRLPTISELRRVVTGCGKTKLGGDCNVTDECYSYEKCLNNACDGCSWWKGPGENGCYLPPPFLGDCPLWYSRYLWSSTEVADTYYSYIWSLMTCTGGIEWYKSPDEHYDMLVRCIREITEEQ